MKRAVILFVALIAFISCGASNSVKGENSSAISETKSAESQIIEVLYLHGKQRCVTCKAIGSCAEEVVTEFANENVVMKTVDFSTVDGEKIADKYEIASSSLIVVKGDQVEDLTTLGFQYAKNNPDQFKKSIKKTIQKMFK